MRKVLENISKLTPLVADSMDTARVLRGQGNEEEMEMAFVNEYIPEADIEKYRIKEIDEKFFKGHYKSHWTVDRERDIYLRYMCNEREEHSNRHTYYFYWKGTPILVTVDKEADDANGEIYWHYKLWRMDIPGLVRPNKTEIVADLKEAFRAYKVRGVYSEDAKFNVDFDF